MTTNAKKVAISLVTFIICNIMILVGIYYFLNAPPSEKETPYLLSEEIYTLKTEYISLLKEVKSLQEQHKTNNDNKIYVQISYKYNELSTISEQINSHMKLNSGENNFYINLPSLDYIKDNTIEELLTYSFD